jgi:hypothetical protein
MYIVPSSQAEYKLELQMISNDSSELFGAQPERNQWGHVTGYRIKRINKTFTLSQRMGCETEQRRLANLDPGVDRYVPGHNGAPVNCCRHVLAQDPVHPCGFKLMPYGLFLCKECFFLLERRKFKYGDMVVNCRDCVEDQARRLKDLNPELFEDLRVRK